MATRHYGLRLLACCVAAGSLQAQLPVDFQRDVRPLLSDRCFACHGPDTAHRKANLRLDRAYGDDGAHREVDAVHVIKPGNLAASELWRRLTTDDADDAMPPASAHKPRLNEQELALVARWIESGAQYEQHWAYRAPVARALPDIEGTAWSRHAIDRFVLRSLQQHGQQPSPPADRRTLLRRVTLDLTGLPPSRDEVHRFLADESPGAYERLVDRLLQSPRYGEHMARYWLDLVRFADTNGVHHDHYRELSPYRDWVIRAFNDNLPYDRFVTQQLAGDLFEQPTNDQLIASGFHRLHMIIDVGTALPEESHARNVIDRVTAFGTAFLGLTVQCAQCHDHKFDPIEQQDFYRFAAFFNNLDADPETGRRQGTDFRRGLQPPFLELPSEEQRSALASADEQLAHAQQHVALLKVSGAFASDLYQALRPEIEVANKQVKAQQKKRDEIEVGIPAAMVMKERVDVRPTHVFERGSYDQPGVQVRRGTPSFLPELLQRGEIASRLDLADWLTSPDHPLTARVLVNRLWQQLFGVGIVKTSEDFGSQGEPPSHPELLDYLAVQFVRSGWDIKALVRTIVRSETYRQSSVATRAAYERDPDNRLLARGSRFRLDAEMIRDQILMTSGLLSSSMYGRSVKPPQPKGIWRDVTLPTSSPRFFRADEGEKARRRSVYTFWKRGMPPPQMTILNAPTRESCVTRRERTNTPLQALLLLNEQEYLKAARQLALTMLHSQRDVPAERLAFVYETVTSHLPDAQEEQALLQSLRELRELYRQRPDQAAKLCQGVALDGEVTAVELAAWTMLVSVVYNLDMTRTRQ